MGIGPAPPLPFPLGIAPLPADPATAGPPLPVALLDMPALPVALGACAAGD